MMRFLVIWSRQSNKKSVSSWSDCKDTETGIFSSVLRTKNYYFRYFSCLLDRGLIKCFRSLISTQPKDRKILIILDNASWHKKAVRLSVGDPLYKNVKFLFLSPYSPDYNPIERVWRLVRYERTRNRYFEGIDVLREVLYDYFTQYMRPNRKFQALCSNYK